MRYRALGFRVPCRSHLDVCYRAVEGHLADILNSLAGAHQVGGKLCIRDEKDGEVQELGAIPADQGIDAVVWVQEALESTAASCRTRLRSGVRLRTDKRQE